jgi:hypothetical protein
MTSMSVTGTAAIPLAMPYVCSANNDHQQPANLGKHNPSSTSSFCSIDLICFLCSVVVYTQWDDESCMDRPCVYKGQGSYGKFYNRALTSHASSMRI